MAFSNWLKRIFGSQNNEQNDVKIYTRTIGELQESPLTAWGNQDIINGLRFNATLQLRTPLRVLKHHNEFFSGRGAPPRFAEELWEGVWSPVTKSWSELAGPNSKFSKEQLSKLDMAMEQVPSDEENHLKFLLVIRCIVERNDSIIDRLNELEGEVSNEKWNDFVQRYGGEKAIIDYFFPRFIDRLPGLQKETVASLRELNLTTPASIATASDKELLVLKGIGPAKLKKIREICAGASDHTSELIDLVRS
ncbi:MAG: hypothetical protein NTY86_17785 [Deltaproteobacteria bacterium]|nr:hypothetical protein [Deltaproteobacteria bacterium]